MHKQLRLHIHLDSGDERALMLPVGATLEVGRARAHADLFVADLACARRHLRLERTSASRVLVHDLGGGSGTLLAIGLRDRAAIARRLVLAAAELRVVHAGLVAACGPDGPWSEVAGAVRVLHGTSSILPSDALLIVPGAVLFVDHRDPIAPPHATPPTKAGRLPEPAHDGWEALSDLGFFVTDLADLARQDLRTLVPALGQRELFRDAPRLPGLCAELSAVAFADLLRRFGEGLAERSFRAIELVLRVPSGAQPRQSTAAVVRRHGELRYVERALSREGEIGQTHDLLERWLAATCTRAHPALEIRVHAGADRATSHEPEPYAMALGTGGELTFIQTQEALATHAARVGSVDHLIDLTGPRPYCRRGAAPPEILTPAEVSILLAYVARALGDGRPMRADAFSNPFSATPAGRKHAFKTMRKKADAALERGRFGLFPTLSTTHKGGAEYAFAPRSGITYCVLMLAADFERARHWLRDVPP